MNFAALFANHGNSVPLLGNKHRARHTVPPFTDDQHKSHLFFRSPFQETHNPLTHGAHLPSLLEDLISCAVSSHRVPSHRTCAMICNDRCVVMCSWCSLTVGLPGSRMFVTCALPSSRLTILHVLVVRLSSLFATNALSHSDCFSQRSPNCGLTVSVRLDLSSTIIPPAVKKLGCCSRT